MPNRQYGRNRSPAGGRSSSGSRSPTGGRTSSGFRNPARTVSVSRFPSGGQSLAGGQSPADSGLPGYLEPEVRRWPHPVEDGTPVSASGPEPALHYIRCALSYQNQLLADIKALLERIAAAQEETEEEKTE